MVQAARDMATTAHRGQTDKAGAEYIGHPRRVAAAVSSHARSEWLPQAQAAAWLHDVLEDTAVTAEQLTARFPAEVVQAVRALTRRPGQNQEAYYAAVRANPIARAVKHADLDDNTDPERVAALDAPTRERLRVKYAHAREQLK